MLEKRELNQMDLDMVAGGNIFDDVWDGIKSVANPVADGVEDAAKTVIDGVAYVAKEISMASEGLDEDHWHD